jgi:hypothetical protein
MLYQRKKYIQLGQLQLKGAYISAGGGAAFIVSTFQARVLTNLGTIEAVPCLQSTIASFLSIDLAP